MVRLLFLDILRELNKNKMRLISILVLIFISVLTFTGIYFAVKMLRDLPQIILNEINFEDISIRNNLGLDNIDESIISSNKNIKDYEMVNYVDTRENNNNYMLRIHSMPNNISKLILQRGEYPKHSNEIVLDYFKYGEEYKIGDTINIEKIESPTNMANIKHDEFYVTGFVYSGNYILDIPTKLSTAGGGLVEMYGYVTPETFDSEYYQEAKVVIHTNNDSFSKEYEREIQALISQLESEFKDRPDIKLNKQKEQVHNILDQSQIEIDTNKRKLLDGKSQLTNSENILFSGELELNQGKDQLFLSKLILDRSWREYNQGFLLGTSKINKEKEKLEQGIEELKKGQKELEDGKNQINQYKIFLENNEKLLKKERQSLINAEKIINKNQKKYDNGLKTYYDGLAQYNDGLKKIKLGEEEYKKGLEEYNLGKAQLEKNRNNLEVVKNIIKLLESLGIDLDDIIKNEAYILQKIDDLNIDKNQIVTIIKNLEKEKEDILIEIKSIEDQLEEDPELKLMLGQFNLLLKSIENELDKYNISLKEISKEIQELIEDLSAFNRFLSKYGISKNMISSIIEYISNLDLIEKELLSYEIELKKGKNVLDKEYKRIESGKKELYKVKQELDLAYNELQKGEKELKVGIEKLSNGKLKLNDGEYQLKKGVEQLYISEKELEIGIKDYKSSEEQLKKGQQLLEKEEMLFDEDITRSYNKLKEGEKKYESGKSEIEHSINDYYTGFRQLTDGKTSYIQTYDKSIKQLNDGQSNIDKERDNLKKLKAPDFAIESRKADQSYYMISDFHRTLMNLVYVFSLLTVAVAMLVSTTTLSRTIDEQRILIGTFKGLGLYQWEIFLKYLIFASIPGFIGSILGALFGQKILAPMIYDIYMIGSIFESFRLGFDLPLALISLVFGLGTIVAAVYITLNKELKSNATTLLRPKEPGSGNKIFLERFNTLWSNLSFMNKITLRNLFRYKGRMIMTILGVGVCLSLLILSFSMEFSIEGVVERQYEEINLYTDTLFLTPDMTDDDLTTLSEYLNDKEEIDRFEYIYSEQLRLEMDDGEVQDVTVNLDEEKGFKDIIVFIDIDGKEIDVSSGDILITKKLAKLMNVNPGDTITVDIDDTIYDLKIDYIVENYIGHEIFINGPDILKENMDPNTVLVRADRELSDVTDNQYILGHISNSIMSQSLEDTVDSLKYIVIIIITISSLLIFVVLYSLTNINVSERIRELSTMKVLGFYNHEVTTYIFKEVAILTIIGIIFGGFLGVQIVNYILDAFAPSNIEFGNPNYLYSILLGASITIIFTTIVAVVIHIKLKKIDMLEALAAKE